MNELTRLELTPRPIRKWACHRLECFADYIVAYAEEAGNDYYYLEPYAGGGKCLCKGTDCSIDDSSLRALKASFARYIFVVENDLEASSLQQLTSAINADKTTIINDNCNQPGVIRQLFDMIPRSGSSFAFINPSGYRRLRWTTIKRLATHGADWGGNKTEMLIVFPLEMALVRNLMRPECRTSITRLYGNHQWEEIKQARLDGKIGLDEVRYRLVELFKSGLKDLGYKYVTDFKPAFFSRSPVYHLIWASDRNSGTKMLEDAWSKPRYLPCELLYSKNDNSVK